MTHMTWNHQNPGLSGFFWKIQYIWIKINFFLGQSEVEKHECGFKVFSTHIWTKEIEIPENIEPESIKAKISPENILKITAQKKNDDNIDIEIPDLE